MPVIGRIKNSLCILNLPSGYRAGLSLDCCGGSGTLMLPVVGCFIDVSAGPFMHFSMGLAAPTMNTPHQGYNSLVNRTSYVFFFTFES